MYLDSYHGNRRFCIEAMCAISMFQEGMVASSKEHGSATQISKDVQVAIPPWA